ncbi:MAG: ankyrin repeat domain-containing protein [Micavibrio sp.]|nr:ankyrin repeat domain-containing protein [Micavibrio sp.]
MAAAQTVDWLIDQIVHLGSPFNDAAHKAHHSSPEEAQRDFFKAIMKEQIGEVITIAARYKNDWQNWREAETGFSPLRFAQDSLSFQSFVQLCGMGAEKNEDYGNGWSPFLFAVNYGDRTFIDYTLGHKPALDALAVTDGKGHTATALHLAIERRDFETVEQLIEHGADTGVKANTRHGLLTPQEYAEARHETKLAEMLSLAPQIRQLHEERFAPYVAALRTAPKPALKIAMKLAA